MPVEYIKNLLSKVTGAGKADRRSVPSAEPETPQAAAYWNDWQTRQQHNPDRWKDWGEHPGILSCIYQHLFKDPDSNVFDFLKRDYPHFARLSALSLCCGDGSFEKALVQHGVFRHVTGIDLADSRIKAAENTNAELVDHLAFITGDVNLGEFGHQCYDIVFAKAALHHIENLEALFAGIKQCLRPGGSLVTIDFFGPTRFQWTATQLDHAQAMLENLPEASRRRKDGSIKTTITRPTIAEMIEADPSEAVRSADILPFIHSNFTDIREFNIGGTLMHLVFTPDILDNFDPKDIDAMQWIVDAYQRELALITAGVLASDFRFIVAA